MTDTNLSVRENDILIKQLFLSYRMNSTTAYRTNIGHFRKRYIMIKQGMYSGIIKEENLPVMVSVTENLISWYNAARIAQGDRDVRPFQEWWYKIHSKGLIFKRYELEVISSIFKGKNSDMKGFIDIKIGNGYFVMGGDVFEILK
jgi:hypothetical protein